jgi:hypothetical protein
MKKIIMASVVIILVSVVIVRFQAPNSGIETKLIKIGAGMSDQIFLRAVGDLDGKIIARGDANGDGYEDVLVQNVYCGASCSVNLSLVLNDTDTSAKVAVTGDNFPGYNPSSAIKSDITSASIEKGLIILTGHGLDCGNNSSSVDVCTQEKWRVLHTIKFKLKSKSDAPKYALERV